MATKQQVALNTYNTARQWLTNARAESPNIEGVEAAKRRFFNLAVSLMEIKQWHGATIHFHHFFLFL